jgi:hypothetical protein
MMKKLFAMALVLAVNPISVAEPGGEPSSIPLASLGSLRLEYTRAEQQQSYPGQPVPAEVTFRRGTAFSLVAPRRVQQIRYLVELGERVSKGQPVAVMRGPEMHHFLYEVEAGREILAAAERRYESNKPLYERKAISESNWLEVSENYYAARLAYEHNRHFYDLVLESDDARDSIEIAAPVAGLVGYSPGYSGLAAGDDIAVFVPENAVRLQLSLPAASSRDVLHVQAGDCQLDISSVGRIADGFLVEGWTEPVPGECGLILGQTLLVTPHYATTAVRIPATALFQWLGSDYVLIRRGDTLVPLRVELVASADGDYLVRAAAALQGSDILRSSVSAVQGILLGLGGE